MTAAESLILYSRAECHLCDQVVELMDRCGVQWRPVDIDADPVLTEKYGLRVPVLQHPQTGKELFFPFSEGDLLQFFRDEP